MPARSFDAESLSWWSRLHAVDPVRRCAIAELHERLRREARFLMEDLALQATNDALIVLLRKLDDYRGDSQFWTWARRFAELEAPVIIRRRLSRERRVSGDPEASHLNTTPGAVYKTLHDARVKLRAGLALRVEDPRTQAATARQAAASRSSRPGAA